jgi:hypothetical protein
METLPERSTYLINEYPIMVYPSLAEALGLNESIVVQQVHYWVGKKPKTRDGFNWTYNSYTEWKKQFPFWSERSIQYIFRRLEIKKILITGKFNKLPQDRTKWYRVNYQELDKICMTMTQSLRQHDVNFASPLPDTSSDSSVLTNVNTGESLNTEKEEKPKKCPNPNGHIHCAEYVIGLLGKRPPVIQMQLRYLHDILKSGYAFEDINREASLISKNEWYQKKGWDFATIAREIGKPKNEKGKYVSTEDKYLHEQYLKMGGGR